MWLHANGNTWLCPGCGHKFSTSKNLKKHQQYHCSAADTQLQMSTCTQCGKQMKGGSMHVSVLEFSFFLVKGT